ncbi:MAG: hypothetical protein IPN01_32245 [Deltaproteobacteria bacterium]|nr:hypothetical protein [Deltaproteobacteria bacterium]
MTPPSSTPRLVVTLSLLSLVWMLVGFVLADRLGSHKTYRLHTIAPASAPPSADHGQLLYRDDMPAKVGASGDCITFEDEVTRLQVCAHVVVR